MIKVKIIPTTKCTSLGLVRYRLYIENEPSLSVCYTLIITMNQIKLVMSENIGIK